MDYRAIVRCFGRYVWLSGCVGVLVACGDDKDPSAPPVAGGSSGASGAGGSGMVGGGTSGTGGAGAAPFGDVGASCDPESSESTCAAECLPLSDGSGVCIDVCGSDPASRCPDGFKCNEVPLEQGAAQICLPNASCGDLEFYGNCAGAILRYCDVEGPREVDCAQVLSASGEPSKCALVNEEIGFDCVAASFTGGCGSETEGGRCDGNTRIYCGSQASGTIVTEDCDALGMACLVGPDGVVTCGDAGATGCGALTFEGECDGSVLRYCRDSEIVSVDCASSGDCRWEGNEIGFNCAPSVVPGGQYRVIGNFSFEKPAVTANGLGEISPTPVRHALVRALRLSDGAELARSYTATSGAFDLIFDEPTDVMVEVAAIGDMVSHSVSVRNCPLADCGGVGTVYSAVSAPFTPATEVDLGSLLIPLDSNAGAFNIFDQFVRGADFAAANLGQPPPTHIAEWAPGSDTECHTSCFARQGNMLFILGTFADSDEFDDSVLFHEYGHFLESAFSRSDSPGGPHDGSPTDPRLAWGEGYGTYVGVRIAGTPLYIDTQASGASVTDVREVSAQYNANASDIRRMNQPVSEYLVAAILWQLDAGIENETMSLGSPPVFDVLGNYFRGAALVDRGVQGVELVDFLDGWFCRGHGERELIEQIVNNKRGFPYDYATMPSCR